MRGRAGLSDRLFAGNTRDQRNPSSVGFAATFSRKREKES
jgi:hypothetical protein